jgi:hypothetical protein
MIFFTFLISAHNLYQSSDIYDIYVTSKTRKHEKYLTYTTYTSSRTEHLRADYFINYLLTVFVRRKLAYR